MKHHKNRSKKRPNPRNLGRRDQAPAFVRWKRPAIFSALVLSLFLGATGLRALVLARAQPSVGGPYALVNDLGQAVTQRDFNGRYTLIYFGYTHCIDVCPLTLATVTAALGDLGSQGKMVTPVFITVDPARDTPPVVKDYVSRFSPLIVGLTGSASQLQPVIAAFHVTAHRRTGMAGMADDSYLMDHSSVLYLMDGSNRLVTMFPVDSSPQEIARQLRRVLPTA